MKRQQKQKNAQLLVAAQFCMTSNVPNTVVMFSSTPNTAHQEQISDTSPKAIFLKRKQVN